MTRRHPNIRRLHLVPLLAFALATCLGTPIAEAGQFAVSPVRIYMEARDRAAALTITNEAQDELVMQADIFVWKQKPGGEDDLELSEDLIVSPPIIKLAPGARQVVRVARLKLAPSNDQQTYRVIIREIAEARPPKGIEVQIALAFSLPIFITPPTARPALDCNTARVAPDELRVDCTNGGNAYVHPREFALLGAGGEKLALRDSGGYLLPGIQRSFPLKRSDGTIPAGKATLAVALDDGSTKSFDVQLAP
jgi:fimbrial chaperone protein